MADAAVELLLENLQQLQLHHAHLISEFKDQVEMLEKDLRLIQYFIKGTSTTKRTKDDLQELVRQIRDVVYEAEDMIDALVTQAAESKTKSFFPKSLQSRVKLHSIAIEVKTIGDKVRDIYGHKTLIEFASVSDIGDEGLHEIEAPRQEILVGIDDEAETLIKYLTEETQQLDVISIIGMPGMGKTTVAVKIFHHQAIQYKFPIRIWVYVSQEFARKDVFLAILRQFTGLSDDMYRKSDLELAQIVAAHLEKEVFLIVMDDVWGTNDWDKLQIALPKKNKMGKVLITSRFLEVARYANPNRRPHMFRFLTEDESWLLLKFEVFGKPQCPPQLEVLGKLIAQMCHGLPTLVLIIGGILAQKVSASNDMNATTKAWEELFKSIRTILDKDRGDRNIESIISLSYNELPHHLRQCFLYLGMFPEDFEIPVWKLVRMWIAEGFIQQRSGMSLEETAEYYLENLIARNLVKAEKYKSDGRVKTCRTYNDMIHYFCKKEAGNEMENFLREIKIYSYEDFKPPASYVEKYRRLCIHSNVLYFLSSKPYGPRVRTLTCFSNEEITLPAENISDIPTAFKLLRVLDIKPIKFSKFSRDLYQLVHLRYIALSFNLAVLPAAFSKLWNIQTLIVDTTSPTLEIKADIWDMIQLRHLKTNASAVLPKTGKSSKGSQKLQTLGTISLESCTEDVFVRAGNLKKLSIRGRLALLLDGKNGSFDSLGKLDELEKLKLLNDVFPSPPLEGQLRGLPPPYKFPPKLRSLTLSDTFLDWSHMSILGLLENLVVLKLKDKAFMGKCWKAADGGFRRLEVLHIGSTDLIVWVASGHHFPRLRRLELQNCEELQEVPIGLADIPSLQLLDLYFTKLAAASAKKIYEAKKNQEEHTANVREFELSIFPPDELSASIF